MLISSFFVQISSWIHKRITAYNVIPNGILVLIPAKHSYKNRTCYSSIQHILFVIEYRKYFNIYWQQQQPTNRKKGKFMARHPKIYSITESNEFLNNGHFLYFVNSNILFLFFCIHLWTGIPLNISGEYSSNRQNIYYCRRGHEYIKLIQISPYNIRDLFTVQMKDTRMCGVHGNNDTYLSIRAYHT